MRRGLALILVVGVLGILAVLGSAFAVLSRLERHAARQRVLGTQALLLTRSGIEDGLARVCMGQDPSEVQNLYRGEDWNDDGKVTGLESASEAYQPGKANLADCPARCAMAPSFFKRHPTDLDSKGRAAPERIPADGRERGYTGRLAQGTWALQVEDESAKINVNGGFLDAGSRDGDAVPDHRDMAIRLTTALSDTGLGWNAQLVQVLGTLAGQLGLPPTLGTDVLSGRPEGGYRSISEVQALVGGTTDLSPYLTVASWVDRKVVRPQSWNWEVVPMYDWCPAGQKEYRAPLALEQGGRPPVNLNAAPRPVLYALLAVLKGRCSKTPDNVVQISLWNPTCYSMVATRMVNWRSPSPPRTWAEFSVACDSSIAVGSPFGVIHADLIKANFNPETQSNKELPDQLRYLWLDKTDLYQWTTEGSLRPTGVFRISCVGRVRGTEGRKSAESTLSTTLRAYDLYRQTSQKDFAGDRTSLYDGAGDGFLSLAGAPAMPTYRSIGGAAGASWWGGSPHPEGLGMMSYPAPPPALAAGAAAACDGYLGLATVEESPGNPTGGTLCFQCHFDDGFEADFGGAPGLLDQTLNVGTSLDRGDDAKLQTSVSSPVWPALPGERPNTLYPDGCHAQMKRAPAYEAAGNFPSFQDSGNRAVFLYWVKRSPTFTTFGTLAGVQTDCSVFRKPGAQTQAFGIGRCTKYPAGVDTTGAQLGIVVERNVNAPDPNPCNSEQHFRIREVDSATGLSLLPGLRWNLVAGWVDTNETAPGGAVQLRCLRQGYPLNQMWNETGGGWYVPISTVGNQDLFASDAFLSLGTVGPRESANFENQVFWGLSNQVIDELSIYDFGDNIASAFNNGLAWAQQRFRDGRYYKGDDANFTSVELSPDPGRKVHLLSARWTAYLPAEPRRDVFNATGPFGAFYGVVRPPDSVLARASVSVDLRLGTAPLAVSVPLREGRGVGLSARSFRYRVRIRPNLADPALDPVLETPIFDEITFVYQKEGGPEVLSWER